MRNKILDLAKEAVNRKSKGYGKPEDIFSDIAEVWSWWLQTSTFTAHDVAVMMLLMKVTRLSYDKENIDTYVDIAGYAACAAECAINGDNPVSDEVVDKLAKELDNKLQQDALKEAFKHYQEIYNQPASQPRCACLQPTTNRQCLRNAGHGGECWYEKGA